MSALGCVGALGLLMRTILASSTRSWRSPTSMLFSCSAAIASLCFSYSIKANWRPSLVRRQSTTVPQNPKMVLSWSSDTEGLTFPTCTVRDSSSVGAAAPAMPAAFGMFGSVLSVPIGAAGIGRFGSIGFGRLGLGNIGFGNIGAPGRPAAPGGIRVPPGIPGAPPGMLASAFLASSCACVAAIPRAAPGAALKKTENGAPSIPEPNTVTSTS
mmetsp:Transcript_12041/g.39606  ORF Transcript_12041/g.39606 Transcript_12041/m.39606 type:complete len:213 (-) Transcript_12041:351-989(-)